MSLTQSAEAISTGEVETQTLDRRNKAYQKVMADREEALRIIDRERNLKQAIPQDRVAAGQQYIKKVESMQGAPKYPIKSQYTAAMERLQPNNYTDPIERQVAHEIVNKEKLDKAQREYQRIAERTASATPEERKEIAKKLGCPANPHRLLCYRNDGSRKGSISSRARRQRIIQNGKSTWRRKH